MHAARYACVLTREYQFRYITLLHAYQIIVPTTTLPVDSFEVNEIYKASMEQLKDLQNELPALAAKDTMFRIRSEAISLGESINEICREEKADMAVMGITGKSTMEKVFIGSNAINVSQNSQYPVLIVPQKAKLAPVRNILFACDLSEVAKTTPLGALDEVLKIFNAPLSVLNVDEKNRHFSPQTPEEMHQLHHIFDKYKPRYAFTDHEDTAAGIIDYAEKNDISLIITIRKNYDFFKKLFHKSTTQKLIYQSAIPVLTIHE